MESMISATENIIEHMDILDPTQFQKNTVDYELRIDQLVQEKRDEPSTRKFMMFGVLGLRLSNRLNPQEIDHQTVLNEDNIPRIAPPASEDDFEFRGQEMLEGPIGAAMSNLRSLRNWLIRFDQGERISMSFPVLKVKGDNTTMEQWASALIDIEPELGQLRQQLAELERTPVSIDETTKSIQKTGKTFVDKHDMVIDILGRIQDSMDRKHHREMGPLSDLGPFSYSMDTKLTQMKELMEAGAAMSFQLARKAFDGDGYRVMASDFLDAWKRCLQDPAIPDQCKNTGKDCLVKFPPSWVDAQNRAFKKRIRQERGDASDNEPLMKRQRCRVRLSRQFKLMSLFPANDEEETAEVLERRPPLILQEKTLPPAPIEYQIVPGQAPRPQRFASGGSYNGPEIKRYQPRDEGMTAHRGVNNCQPGPSGATRAATNQRGTNSHRSRGSYRGRGRGHYSGGMEGSSHGQHWPNPGY